MKLSSVDLNLLVALDALLQEQSVTRAAERLFVGQPAMTATLNRLRALFEDPLMVRSGRGMQLTPLAESLRAPLAGVLNDVQRLFDAPQRFDPATSERVFTVTASDYAALVMLRPLLSLVARLAPGVQIRVFPVQAGLLEDLGKGLTDLVIYPRHFLPKNLAFSQELLFRDEFVCVADAAHPDLDQVMTREQFTGTPFLEANLGVMRSAGTEYLEQEGLRMNTVMTAQSFVVAPLLLSGTRMFTIVQRRLIEAMPGNKVFKLIEAPFPLPVVEEVMLWLPRNSGDPGLAWLRGVLSELAGELSAGAPGTHQPG